jgi:hypothetical protein
MSKRFSLKWADFQSVVSQSFSVLRQEADFCDVTLVSDDHTQISAHKLVLSASSDFFKSVSKRNPHSHPLIYLSGVDSTILGFVLDYIYQGEVKLTHHDLDPFLDVAQKLKIEGLLTTEETTLQQQQQQQQQQQPEPQKETEKQEELNLQDPKEQNVKDLKVESQKIFVPESDSQDQDVIEEPTMKIDSEQTIIISADVEQKIEQLMEKRGKQFYCLACNYFSSNKGHSKEHAEKHIAGLSYFCQVCFKTVR